MSWSDLMNSRALLTSSYRLPRFPLAIQVHCRGCQTSLGRTGYKWKEIWISYSYRINQKQTNKHTDNITVLLKNEKANTVPLLLAFQLFPAIHELICLLFPCGKKRRVKKSVGKKGGLEIKQPTSVVSWHCLTDSWPTACGICTPRDKCASRGMWKLRNMCIPRDRRFQFSLPWHLGETFNKEFKEVLENTRYAATC